MRKQETRSEEYERLKEKEYKKASTWELFKNSDVDLWKTGAKYLAITGLAVASLFLAKDYLTKTFCESHGYTVQEIEQSKQDKRIQNSLEGRTEPVSLK